MLTCKGTGMPSNRSCPGGRPAIEWTLDYWIKKILRFAQYATITASITFSSKRLSNPQDIKNKSSVPTCGHFQFDGPRVVPTGVTQWSAGRTGIEAVGDIRPWLPRMAAFGRPCMPLVAAPCCSTNVDFLPLARSGPSHQD